MFTPVLVETRGGVERWSMGGAEQARAVPERTPIIVERAAREKEEAEDSSAVPLTDKFGRFHDYLRISLTEKCNLRWWKSSKPSHSSSFAAGVCCVADF